MFTPLASAAPNDAFGVESKVLLALVIAAVAAVAAGIASVPVFLARARRHRHLETVAALAVLWGIVAAGGAVATIVRQTNAAREQIVELRSGYGDPTADPTPAQPWALWGGLAGTYAVLVVATTRGGRRLIKRN